MAKILEYNKEVPQKAFILLCSKKRFSKKIFPLRVRIAVILLHKQKRLGTYVELGLVALGDLVEVELTNFLFETGGETRVHSRSTRQDDVLVELGTSINVSGLNGVEQWLGHARGVDVNETRVEQSFRSNITLTTNLDNTTVGQLDAKEKR